LIEARSCDRMKAMSLHLEDKELRILYRDLLESEARHHHSYVEMASSVFDRDRVRARLKEMSAAEVDLIAIGGPEPRMHN
jgi:tRNA-(ms[2]io[6]A)-hydroxylase